MVEITTTSFHPIGPAVTTTATLTAAAAGTELAETPADVFELGIEVAWYQPDCKYCDALIGAERVRRRGTPL